MTLNPVRDAILAETRRQFFSRMARGIGGIALGSLIAEEGLGSARQNESTGGLPSLPHFPPKAKRCIYLHMMGAPPQMDMLDYKPGMKDWFDKDLPESVRKGQRLTTMTSGQARFPIAPSVFSFAQHGKSGAFVSELLPHTAKMVDEEIKRIIDQTYGEAKQLLEAHRAELQRLAEALLKYETLNAEEVGRLMRGEPLGKPTVSDLLRAEQDKSRPAPKINLNESDTIGRGPTSLPSPA